MKELDTLNEVMLAISIFKIMNKMEIEKLPNTIEGKITKVFFEGQRNGIEVVEESVKKMIKDYLKVGFAE